MRIISPAAAIVLLAACDRGAPAIRSLAPPALPPAEAADSLLGLLLLPAESLPQFETREHGYEEESAAVYGIGDDGSWLLAGLREGGRAWVGREAGEFLPIEALLRGRLTHLAGSWDRSLRFAPHDKSLPRRVPGLEGQSPDVPARLLGTRVVHDALWLEVEVLDRICDGDSSTVLAKGWVPAWTAGQPTMWFYSRGC